MLSFDFTNAFLERAHVRTDYDLEIGVVADFEIMVREQVVYHEVLFPIVELRVALDRWVKNGSKSPDFEFVSMESDEVGLVWLRRQPSGNWRVGSVHQDRAALEELEWNEVRQGVIRYVEDVDSWVADHLGVSVTDFIRP